MATPSQIEGYIRDLLEDLAVEAIEDYVEQASPEEQADIRQFGGDSSAIRAWIVRSIHTRAPFIDEDWIADFVEDSAELARGAV